MAENNNFINVGGRLHSIATGNVLAGTNEIYDDGKGKKQSTINAETDAILAQHTSVIQSLNSQNYETYAATNQTTAVTDVLPATGNVNTVYRLGNWDGSQFDPSCYTEYSWDGTQYIPISTKTQIDEVFDISAYHASGGILATYADLSAALDSNNGSGVPQSLQRGGMSIKFVCSSDNKYVQYRLMSNTFSTTESDWQGVDNEPTAGSDNLIKSGGVAEQISQLEQEINKLKNAGYLYAGIAIPTTDPGTSNLKVFYIANGKGTYTNFGNLEVTEDEIVILYYDTVWHKVSTGIASHKILTSFKEDLEEKITKIDLKVGEYEGEQYPVVDFLDKIRINTKGYLQDDDYFKTSKVIYLKKGECVVVNCTGKGYCVVATGNNVPYNTPVIADGISDVFKEYSFTATNDTSIRICIPLATENKAVIKKTKSIIGVLESNRIKREVELKMESGCFSILQDSYGETKSVYNEITPFCSFMCRNFLKVNYEYDVIANFKYDSRFRVIAFFYDSNFESSANYWASNTDIEFAIPYNTSYVRFGLTQIDRTEYVDKTHSRPTLSFELTSSTEPVFVFDGYRPTKIADYYTMLQYELKSLPLSTNDSDFNGYVGNKDLRVLNSGMIMLPHDYNPFGTPTPLIIFVNGSGGWSYDTDTPWFGSDKWRKNFEFFTAMGYAVAACGSRTNRYTIDAYDSVITEGVHNQNDRDNQNCCNLSIQCYKDLYEYIQRYFNVSKSVYVLGKSSGGGLAACLSYLRPFPISACASFAPGIDIISTWKQSHVYGASNFWAECLGISNPNIPIYDNENWGSDKERIKGYIPNIIGFDPITQGMCGVNLIELSEAIVDAVHFHEYEDMTLYNMFSNSHKIMPTPIKIWHAIDDANTPYGMSKFFQMAVHNGGGYCYLRTLPEGAGQHGAADGGEGALMMDVSTPKGTMSVPVAIVEAIDWFKQW